MRYTFPGNMKTTTFEASPRSNAWVKGKRSNFPVLFGLHIHDFRSPLFSFEAVNVNETPIASCSLNRELLKPLE